MVLKVGLRGIDRIDLNQDGDMNEVMKFQVP